MSEVYEPWKFLVDASAADAKWWRAAGAFTGLVLAKVGEWLWRACPELADGGDELVLVPHRLFRSLPLSHCQLPGGARLSDGFGRVFISPSLYDFSLSLGQAQESGPSKSIATALVDPDGSLPFARVEGLRAAGADSTRMGSEVTVAAIREALSKSGLVLISCHGDFDESNPWQSTIAAADGAFRLHELLDPACNTAADLVVLGACEAARTRRSQSDEPLGFPGMLVEGGVKAVLAPLWKVDDFLVPGLRLPVSGAAEAGQTPGWGRPRDGPLAPRSDCARRPDPRRQPAPRRGGAHRKERLQWGARRYPRAPPTNPRVAPNPEERRATLHLTTGLGRVSTRGSADSVRIGGSQCPTHKNRPC